MQSCAELCRAIWLRISHLGACRPKTLINKGLTPIFWLCTALNIYTCVQSQPNTTLISSLKDWNI